MAVRQFRERDFRLDVPELGDVALGVGLLCPEGRAEGVDLAEGHRGHFAFELAGDGEARLLAEEVVGIVVVGVVVVGLCAKGLRGHLEHFAGAFRVRTGDERRVHIDITILLEVLMDGSREDGAHVEYRVEGVRAQTDVRHGAQELERMALLLKRVVRGAVAEEFDLGRVDLHAAFLVDGGRHDRAGHAKRDAKAQELRQCIALREFGFIDDDLDVLERGAVVEFGERHGLGVARCTDPAADGDLLADELGVGHYILDVDVFHVR